MTDRGSHLQFTLGINYEVTLELASDPLVSDPSPDDSVTLPFLRMFERVLGRPLRPADGIDVGHMARSEQRLGVVFPMSVSDFYAAAGAAPELQTHNRLRQPDSLEVEDGYLVFMEENQNIVDWGLRLPLTHTGDPEVWQRVNDGPPAWYSEEMSFSEFIVRNFAFVQGVDLSDDELNRLRGAKG